jgi:hypothetical protein
MGAVIHMKKIARVVLMVFAFVLPCNTAFSEDNKPGEKTKAHLLQEILVLNKQISNINRINNKSRDILKKSRNKYALETYLSFVNIYRTFLWSSDLVQWLSQTYDHEDNMNSHICARLNANKISISKSLAYMHKIYGKINDVSLLNLMDTQEKNIALGMGQLNKILRFIEAIEKKS